MTLSRFVLSLSLLAASAPVAGADSLEAGLEVSPSPEGDEAPGLRATVDARPGLTEGDFVLEALDAKPPVKIAASEAVPFAESDRQMSLVLLVQGTYAWLGNETYVEDDDPEGRRIYVGAFQGLVPAVDVLAEIGPPGSRGALLVYGDELMVKQPMDDLSELSGADLGAQADYEDDVSRSLLDGLTKARDLLTGPSAADHRKVLVVFGDGTDNLAQVAGPLGEAIDELRDAGIETYTIHYAGATPRDDPRGQENMKNLGYAGHYAAASRDDFESYAGDIAASVGSRYVVDFPGGDVPFDGREHEFAIHAGEERSEPIQLQLPAPEERDRVEPEKTPASLPPRQRSQRGCGCQAGSGASLAPLLLLALLIARRRRG